MATTADSATWTTAKTLDGNASEECMAAIIHVELEKHMAVSDEDGSKPLHRKTH